MRLFTNGRKLVKSITITSTYQLMVTTKKIKDIKGLNQFPDLQEALVPAIKTIPLGSINTKVIIMEGKIVERVYKTPDGDIITHFA